MLQPRVLPVIGARVGQRLVPDWPGAGRANAICTDDEQPVAERWVAWRLLAGNGWEIARSARVFRDIAAAQAAIDLLHAALDRAEWITSRGLRPATWTWELTIDNVPAAVASRVYKLERECHSAVRTFFAVLPQANLSLTTSRLK